MKKEIRIFMCALAMSLLYACGAENESTPINEPESVTQTTSVKATVETDTLETDKPETEIETESNTLAERQLTEEEVQFFEDYVNRADNYGFLLSMYDSPAQVDLEQVFYSGAGMEQAPMSAKEREAYLKTTGMEEIYTDVTHLTTAQIEGFLQEKLGLSLQEMESTFSWVYVPEYDSYYHQAGDTNMLIWDCISGKVVDEEIYTLKVHSLESYVPDCEVTLQKVGDGYQFVSNKPWEIFSVPDEGLKTELTWQQVYREIVENPRAEWVGYDLIYVNDDDIPELVAVGDCAATGCIIFNYDNGMVYETQLNRLYFSYIEHQNLLCNSEGNMHHYYDIVYSIIDGKMISVAVGIYGAADNTRLEFDAEGNVIYTYTWDGVEMTEEEYIQQLNEIYDTSKARDGYEWGEWCTAEEIIEKLK